MKRFCMDCGNPFLGRSDKKFCSDACRNSYNNRINGESNNYIRRVNQILRKNRRILIGNLQEGKTTVKFSRLVSEGFEFNYFTHQVPGKKGQVFNCCYEYGYFYDQVHGSVILKSFNGI